MTNSKDKTGEPTAQPSKKDEQHQWSTEYLLEEFNKESDRASVILVASLLDDSLSSLLRTYLVPTPTSNDELFEGANAPIGTFSAKIDLSFRLGLISAKFCRDLHLIRKIRNSFAHNIFNCSFDNGSIKSRVDELKKSALGTAKLNDVSEDHKGIFLVVTSHMLYELNEVRQEITSLSEREMEFFYKPEPFVPSESPVKGP